MARYDAMFGQAWRSYLEVQTDLETRLPTSPRRALKMDGQAVFGFNDTPGTGT